MNDALIAALSAQLTVATGLATHVSDGVVHITDWPTVAIAVASFSPVSDDSAVYHAVIEFAYNSDSPDTRVTTCVTAVGHSEGKAAENVADTWMRTWAPPLLSLFLGDNFGAARFSHSEPGGVPGWTCWISPCTVSGRSGDEVQKLIPRLDEVSPYQVIADELARRLDKSKPFNSVSLWWWHGQDETTTEVQVNGVPDEDLGRLLQGSLTWESPGWVSFKQCLIVYHAP